MELSQVTAWAHSRKHDGWQFVQMCATSLESGIDLLYTLRKGGEVENRIVCGVTQADRVPSITDWFPAAFVFENEAHDLFGVNVFGISIDFGGKFYNVATPAPMAQPGPERKAARERAKLAAAKPAAHRADKDSNLRPAAAVLSGRELLDARAERARSKRAAIAAGTLEAWIAANPPLDQVANAGVEGLTFSQRAERARSKRAAIAEGTLDAWLRQNALPSGAAGDRDACAQHIDFEERAQRAREKRARLKAQSGEDN